MSSEPCGVRLHELQRWELGELARADAATLEAHVARCPACTARVEALAAERAAFLASNDPAIASAQILAALEAPPPRRRWLGVGALVPALAALAIAIVALQPPAEDRTKGGGPALTMYVQRPGGPALAEPGVTLRAGDQIQFRYRANGRRYLQLVSIDGRGAITLLYPSGSDESAPIEPTGAHAIPESTILDDAVGPERVVALFSDEALRFADVEARVRATLAAHGGDLGSLDQLSWEGADQASVGFVKAP